MILIGVMASGKNHDRAIYFATPVVGILSGYYLSPMLGLIAASSHLLGGLYLSPDLDLKSLPWKRWGILRIIWLPYQRNPSSALLRHAPVLVNGRLVYLGVLLSPVAIAFSRHATASTWKSSGMPLPRLAGVEVSALNHLLLDGLLNTVAKGHKGTAQGGLSQVLRTNFQ
jgi:uncharacterized metal-binding protein